MPVRKLESKLEDVLRELRRTHGETVSLDEVAGAVGDIAQAMRQELGGQESGAGAGLYSELTDLSRYIHDARHEIAALRPDEVKETFIPKATDELDAIVDATAEATNSIMDATEVLEALSDKLDAEGQNALMDATTRIYEACTFQDITGQRITKVVGTLQHIEAKIDALVDAFGPEIDRVKAANTPAPAERSGPIRDEDLLEGPQLPGQDTKQAEIDALLASFE